MVVKEIRLEDGRRGFERRGVIKAGSLLGGILLVISVGGTITIGPSLGLGDSDGSQRVEQVERVAAEADSRSKANLQRIEQIEAQAEQMHRENREDHREIQRQLVEILKRLPAGG